LSGIPGGWKNPSQRRLTARSAPIGPRPVQLSSVWTTEPRPTPVPENGVLYSRSRQARFPVCPVCGRTQIETVERVEDPAAPTKLAPAPCRGCVG